MRPLINYLNHGWDPDKDDIKRFGLKTSESGTERGIFKNKNTKRKMR